MAEVTAIEALKDAHGLTFENVWASIMALSANVNTMAARIDEMTAGMDESTRRSQESVSRMAAKIDDLTQTVREDHANVSGVGNSLGAVMESMFAANICPKFNAFDHTFSKVSNDQKYYRDGKLYCEVDAFLEDGDYVMAIECKTQCEMKDINKHLERLQKLRIYMNEHNDHRIVLGGIAAGAISRKLIEIAESHGLYVMVQNGNAVDIVEKPHEFQEGKW
jgi:hypothetical protein